ncbi:MAG: inositol monophosphatase [Actinobacteria bacterium]|nr:MAG: inositol monophosphatase [Actinomycetota bacterium]
MTTSNLTTQLLHTATTLARQAGAMALEGRRNGLQNVQTKSTATDMVTEFDKASEVMIVQGLESMRPDDAIIGEEGASHSGTSGITWHIDPIDGTTNFLYALPTWAVSIGAVDEQGPIAGAVYIPALDEMFFATRGGGAFCNGAPIRCNPLDDVSKALVCTGFSYAADQRTLQATRVARFIHQVRDIRRFGAASIDMCFVACGRFDAYFEENLHSWDIAAGDLIAREAGCQTGDFEGNAIRPAQVLVSPPQIFRQLSTLILASSARDR